MTERKPLGFAARPRRIFAEPHYFNGKSIGIESADQAHVFPAHCRVRRVRFDKETATVQFLGEGDRWLYEIDLEKAETPEELLHWCFHIGHKDWGTPRVIGAALRIVDRVIWEKAGETAEHCYCYRRADSKGREKNGFAWSAFRACGYDAEENCY